MYQITFTLNGNEVIVCNDFKSIEILDGVVDVSCEWGHHFLREIEFDKFEVVHISLPF